MKIGTMICAAAIALCGTLSAQPGAAVDRIKVHFSTPVEVGSVTIAAGDCSIQMVRGTGDDLLEFQPQSGHAVFVMANRVNEPEGAPENGKSARLVLVRHGDDYRVERILMPDHSGFEFRVPEE